MAKMFKITAWIIGLIILLVLLTIGALITFVSPNQFKPMMIAQVAKSTGRQLTIDGDVSWSFFPYLGFKLGHAVLNNPAGFHETTFAEIDQATVGVKFTPLLHAKIETNGIALAGLKLNLIKNADGTTNWQDLQQRLASASTQNAPVATEVASNQKNKILAMRLEIPTVDVTNAQLHWRDEQAKKSVLINKLELHAKAISLDQAFPLTSSFDFAAQNPTLSGQMTLSGNVKLNLNKQLYRINDLNLSIKTQDGTKNLAGKIQGDLAADLSEQTLTINHLVGNMSNLTLNGDVNVTSLMTNPVAKGHFQTQPFDLKQLLQTIGVESANLQVAKNVAAEFDFSVTTPSADALHALHLQGKVKASELQAAKLKLDDIVIAAQLEKGELKLIPIVASLYQGNLQGNVTINLNSAVPQIALQAKLVNVQAEPLLQDLGSQSSKLKVKGAGNISLQVTTAGMNADAVKRNLNGSGQFSFQQGQLDGVNIGYLLDSAYALVKGKSIPAQNEEVTNFGNLTGTVTIASGVISNKDLFLDSPRFSTAGQGTIDLVNQKLNYNLQIMSKQSGHNNPDQNTLSQNNLAIPVTIAGSFDSPRIGLDTGAIVDAVTKQKMHQVENKVKEKLQEKIKNQLPGQAGELLNNLLGN